MQTSFTEEEFNYEEILKKAGLSDQLRLKCYECQQINFINTLSDIIQVENYNDLIMSLLDDSGRRKGRYMSPEQFDCLYLEPAYDNIRTAVVITKDGEMKKINLVSPTNLIGDDSHHFFKSIYLPESRFHDFLNSLLGYSLSQFLLNNDRRKLKRCQNCKNFYISKTIKPSKFCSDNCRLAYHNRKRIESGEAREYKRKKRTEGAKESYYG